jgi:hypothetical protein
MKVRLPVVSKISSPLFLVLVLVFAAVFVACGGAGDDKLGKISFEVSKLDDDGLYGPPDGRRALDYEFCIPARAECVKEVTSIDSTVVVHESSPGRIGCSADEYLCIGSTHQKDFRRVLRELTTLDYVKRIDRCVYE